MANIPSLPVLNPKDFGCPWDGIHDDLPGFNAMLATIPAGGPYTALIELPYGMGYFPTICLLASRFKSKAGMAGLNV